MTAEPFVAQAYLKTDCPYSFKYLLFMSEAGLLDSIRIVRCDPDSAAFESIKQKLLDATGKPATFPTVEVEPDRYLSDSDRLIAHYAHRHQVRASDLHALAFYKKGIFPQLQKLHEDQAQSHA